MKCALEIALAIAEEERLEKIKKEEAEKVKYQKALETFYEKIDEINEIIENALIKGKGKAEFLLDREYWLYLPNGFYYLAEKNYNYVNKNGGYPHWSTKSLSIAFPLEIYIKYLKSLCYNVEISDYNFIGSSSTGKTKHTVKCKKIKIFI